MPEDQVAFAFRRCAVTAVNDLVICPAQPDRERFDPQLVAFQVALWNFP
jgi:hypothetical protein